MVTVYLDLNKYIELSQLFHHKIEGKSGLLEFLISKKNENKVIFPISASLVIEAAKHSGIDRRKRLAETMLFFLMDRYC